MIDVFDTTDRFPLQKMGRFAGVCWNAPVDDAARNVARAKECIKSGHGRVMEAVDVEMCISGYSARAIREYYTHIGGGPTRLQESTRYVNCEQFDYFVPPTVLSSGKGRTACDESAEQIYRGCMDVIRQKYAELLDAGVSREDAANVLPLGMMTRIVDKRNLRNLVNLMNQRLCSRAYVEIRALAGEIRSSLASLSDEWAWISENLLVPKCEASGFCSERNGCGRRPPRG